MATLQHHGERPAWALKEELCTQLGAKKSNDIELLNAHKLPLDEGMPLRAQLEDNAFVFVRDRKKHAKNMEVLVEKPFGSNDYVVCPANTTADAFRKHLAQNVLRQAPESFELTHSKRTTLVDHLPPAHQLEDGSRVSVRKRTEVDNTAASKRRKH